jgi:hypothetical protein
MEECRVALPRIFTPKVLSLTIGWAILTIQLIVLGVTLMASLADVMSSFRSPLTGLAFFMYVGFIAPYSLARVSSAFLKSVLARESPAAWLGLAASLAGVCGWIVILARDITPGWGS